jgi:hypothetical protein
LGAAPSTASNSARATSTSAGCAIHLPALVGAHGRDRPLGGLGVVAARDERRHPAHRVCAAAVARLDQQLRIRAHERDGHRDVRAVRQDHVPVLPEALDGAEDVVPPAGVQRADAVAQLEEDALHLERCRQRLDEHGDADAPGGEAEVLLREVEHVVPEPRLTVALELGEVEVRAGAALEQEGGVVEEEDARVEQGAGDRLAVRTHVGLVEVPAARPDMERREVLAEVVALALAGGVRQRSADGLGDRDVTVDDVAPGRRKCVLEARHEAVGARVQRVDDHLALRRSGDLDPAVGEVGRRRRDGPVAGGLAVSDRGEGQRAARVELRLALLAATEKGEALLAERGVQLGDEAQRGGRQGLLAGRGDGG